MNDEPGKGKEIMDDEDTLIIENLDLLMDMDVVENESDWDVITDMNNKELENVDEEKKSEE